MAVRALAVAFMMLASERAFADDALRCGEWLVAVGSTAETVAAKCGPPTSATTIPIRRRLRSGRYVSVLRTSWVYDRGPQEFVRTLFFVDGVLQDIEVGDYGR
jgi:hypothetical protein